MTKMLSRKTYALPAQARVLVVVVWVPPRLLVPLVVAGLRSDATLARPREATTARVGERRDKAKTLISSRWKGKRVASSRSWCYVFGVVSYYLVLIYILVNHFIFFHLLFPAVHLSS